MTVSLLLQAYFECISGTLRFTQGRGACNTAYTRAHLHTIQLSTGALQNICIQKHIPRNPDRLILLNMQNEKKDHIQSMWPESKPHGHPAA